jgi:Ras-related protein Rab-11A
MTESSEMIFKILIIGDSTTGKTNILSKYLHNKFDKASKATIGVELSRKIYTIKNVKVEAQIWDTAGQERYRSITKAYYKGALGALIVYDITKKETFDNIENWIADLRNSADKKATIILVGNKNDLEEERKVSKDIGESKAKEFGFAFLETSALNGSNIELAFQTLIEEVYKNHHKEFEPSNNLEILKGKAINLEENEDKKTIKCCDKYYWKALKAKYL